MLINMNEKFWEFMRTGSRYKDEEWIKEQSFIRNEVLRHGTYMLYK